jgi:hypothetical protein
LGPIYGGAADELDRVVRHFDEDSQRSGYDRKAALGLMAKNQERLVRDQAVRMEENVVRLMRLREQQVAFIEGSSVVRFAAFVTGADSELRAATWAAFKPALPLSFDAALFFVLGWIVSFGLMIAIAALFRQSRAQVWA